ncbi:hypothetical protein LTR56_010908 [Elasticomyces elasticus]|nr:hypothetical protein LTR56_010908 [Elasticomyces elasticus]KAK4926609.1 hypothetical protein LTR49_006543 [Elasticomyces elasticus]KAK5760702.1 hypothetical protein LTS12_009239 [Elasticomyces elasticus]
MVVFESVLAVAVLTVILVLTFSGRSGNGARYQDEVLAAYLNSTASYALLAGSYSHYTFVCDKKQWHWHNGALSTPSKYLATVYKKKSKELRVALPSEDCAVMPSLMRYLDPLASPRTKPARSPLQDHLRICLMAKRKRFDTLERMALTNVHQGLQISWDKQIFADVVAEVYTVDAKLGRDLRRAVVQVAVQHDAVLFGSKRRHRRFRGMALANRQFMNDVLEAREVSGERSIGGKLDSPMDMSTAGYHFATATGVTDRTGNRNTVQTSGHIKRTVLYTLATCLCLCLMFWWLLNKGPETLDRWLARRADLEKIRLREERTRLLGESARKASQQRNRVLAAYLPRSAANDLMSGRYSHFTIVCNGVETYWSNGTECEPFDHLGKIYDPSLKGLRIRLDNEDSETVAGVLEYFDTMKRSFGSRYDPAVLNFNSTSIHVRLHFLAKRKENEPLRQAALHNFSDAVKTSWDTPDFMRSIIEIYVADREQSAELRAIAARVTAKHGSVLLGPGRKHVEFREMARSTPAFTADVLKAQADEELLDDLHRSESRRERAQ